ncbi:MAG TPA: hypothetical protein VMV89_05425 [Candidatus Paceibacterota bacterium]|nr:hypothetical protein [Candidatus Paceibacterota bacterium]
MKPTAVIDKSLFQEICSEPDEVQRGVFWKELLSRYQIIIPFVLVEEVWTNLAKPSLKKDPAIFLEMANRLLEMSSCWIDDEVEIVFKELIQKKQLKILPAPAQKTIELLHRLNPNDSALSAWLDQRRQIKERIIRERMQFQNSISPTGKFLTIKSEKELFQGYAWKLFIDILDSKDGGKTILEKLLGWQFRNRHPNFKNRIEKAFSNYTKATFKQFPATFYYLTTDMLYCYTPICRMQKSPTVTPKKILGRKLSEQRNNLEDQKYVVSARMCERLLTRDESMSEMMRAIKECGLWNGETVFIDPRQPLSVQIPSLLI